MEAAERRQGAAPALVMALCLVAPPGGRGGGARTAADPLRPPADAYRAEEGPGHTGAASCPPHTPQHAHAHTHTQCTGSWARRITCLHKHAAPSTCTHGRWCPHTSTQVHTLMCTLTQIHTGHLHTRVHAQPHMCSYPQRCKRVYVCTCVYTANMCAAAHASMHICSYAHMCVLVCVYSPMCLLVQMYSHTYTHVHSHMYLNVHTRVCIPANTNPAPYFVTDRISERPPARRSSWRVGSPQPLPSHREARAGLRALHTSDTLLGRRLALAAATGEMAVPVQQGALQTGHPL